MVNKQNANAFVIGLITQITEVGPPEGSASDKDADRAVHEFRMAKARPSIAKGEKWRFSSCLCPTAAKCASSS